MYYECSYCLDLVKFKYISFPHNIANVGILA